VNNLDGILRDLLAAVLLYTDGSHDDPTRSRLCGPRRNGVVGQRVLRSVKSLKVPAYGGGVPRGKQGDLVANRAAVEAAELLLNKVRPRHP
jgi:hypothetical protein